MPKNNVVIFWNCYLYNGNKDLNKQLTALSRDFNNVILYIDCDKISKVSKYFKSKYKIIDGLYLFSKKEGR